MNLKDILSITGKPGLFKTVAQAKNGVIVESITDGKRFQVFANDKISSLEEISIFTNADDLPLKEVIKRIYDKENGAVAADPKSDDKAMREYFASVVPEYDQERVYVSHIRKILAWYNLLNSHQLIVWDDEPAETDDTAPSETTVAPEE
ncbi:MAG TPA: DUF5606 domain-containing protein [Bacteroidales bacterium]|jgi:Domain of unknown function (DUF5606)